ncbi:hypothetical protein F4680DRAFT_338996 [Xylaria scruposa]|nr:hypothetical protein F4680DRAFT_338996 [Xylaria scruposa]
MAPVPPPAYGIKVLYNCHEATIDICFVHGIDGHRESTWTARGQEAPWPETLLPHRLSTARILAYGYETYPNFTSAALSNNLLQLAKEFLVDLAAVRTSFEESSRPLVLVAHNLGGIVCMEAMLVLKENHKYYIGNLFECVEGIAFMGTPVGGSWMADWAKIPAQAFGVEGSTGSLIDALGLNSEYLGSLQFSFAALLRDRQINGRPLQVACFYEELPMPTLGIVVSKGSATFPGYPSIGIHANHVDMVKFISTEDCGFKRLLGTLVNWELEIRFDRDTTKRLKPPMSTIPAQLFQDCLKSLAFAEMDRRLHDIEPHTNGTCEWLFQHEKYLRWSHSDQGLLWIRGKAGSGKSVLLRHALSRLVSIKKHVVTLSFFFSSHGTELQRTTHGLYRALLYQLLQEVPNEISEIIATFQQRRDKVGEPGEHWNWAPRELSDLFRKVSTTRPVWLFLDALDECDQTTPVNLAPELKDLLETAKDSRSMLHIFFTSRPNSRLNKDVDVEGQIRLEDENKRDISIYIKEKLRGLDHELSATIPSLIKDRGEGSFLWVAMVMHNLSDRGLLRDLEVAAPIAHQELNITLFELVQAMEPHQELLKLIRWVCLASRPLSPSELRWAMAVDGDCSCTSLKQCAIADSFIKDDETMIKRAESLTRGLVTTVEASGTRVIRFIHASVQEFFFKEGLSLLERRARSTDPIIGNAHLYLSKACRQYLQMEEIAQSNGSHDDLMSAFPFLLYATKSWIIHRQYGEVKGAFHVDKSWPSESFARLWVKIYSKLELRSNDCPSQGSSLLHIASRYQLTLTLREIQRKPYRFIVDLGPVDWAGRTPLSLAAEHGHIDIIGWLLDLGAGINARSNLNRTPLSYAVVRGHVEAVKLLIQAGADPDGHRSVAALPLDHGSHESKKNSQGRSLLDLAAEYGHEGVVKLLIDTRFGTDMQAPLASATKNGHVGVVNILLFNGADVNTTDQDGWTPLSWAAANGWDEIVLGLLGRGAVVEAETNTYQTPLSHAAENGHVISVEKLIDHGAAVDTRSESGRTPLSYAAQNGHDAVVRLLLQTGADVDAKDNNGWTPLLWASANGHEAIIENLINYGAYVDVRSDSGQTPLWYAAGNGHETVLKLLLASGTADVNARSDAGVTPLSWAAGNDREVIVTLLLEHGVDANVKDDWGWTPLSYAAKDGYTAIVDALLNADADVECKDDDGWTPLLWAVANGHEAVAARLLAKGADINSESNAGWTPLSWTAIINKLDTPLTSLLTWEDHMENSISSWLSMSQRRLELMIDALRKRSGSLDDLNRMIELAEETMKANHPNRQIRAQWLNHLGMFLSLRYEQAKAIKDLNMAVDAMRIAIDTAPHDGLDKLAYLNQLGSLLGSRFRGTSSVADIDRAIEVAVKAIRATPDNHPSGPDWLNSRAMWSSARFERTGSVDDISRAIEIGKIALDATPKNSLEMPTRLDNLGRWLFKRFERTHSASDIDDAIDFGTTAVHNTPPYDPERAARLTNLGKYLCERFKQSDSMDDILRAIELGSMAVEATTKDQFGRAVYLENLAYFLGLRYERFRLMSDLSHAIELRSMIVDATSLDHPGRAARLSNLGKLLHARFEKTGSMEDLIRAIEAIQMEIDATPQTQFYRTARNKDLDSLRRKRDKLTSPADETSNAPPVATPIVGNETTAETSFDLYHRVQASELNSEGQTGKADWGTFFALREAYRRVQGDDIDLLSKQLKYTKQMIGSVRDQGVHLQTKKTTPSLSAQTIAEGLARDRREHAVALRNCIALIFNTVNEVTPKIVAFNYNEALFELLDKARYLVDSKNLIGELEEVLPRIATLIRVVSEIISDALPEKKDNIEGHELKAGLQLLRENFERITGTWSVRFFCDLRDFRNLLLEGPVDSFLTVTGRESPEDTYAQTSAHYVNWCWGQRGTDILNWLSQLLSPTRKLSEASKTSLLPIQMEGKPNGPVLIELDGRLDNMSSFSLKEYNVVIQVRWVEGGLDEYYSQVADIAIQLAWIAAAFKDPPDNGLSCSQTEFQDSYSAQGSYQNNKEYGSSYRIIQNFAPDRVPREQGCNCWHRLFNGVNIALGFEIPNRPDGMRGVELPFDLMRALTGVGYTVPYEHGLILKGRANALFPVKMEPHSASLGEASALQWHLVSAEEGRLELEDVRLKEPGLFPIKTDTPPTEFLEEAGKSAQHFLGLYENAIVAMGTNRFESDITNAHDSSSIRVQDKLWPMEWNRTITGSAGGGLGGLSGSIGTGFRKRTEAERSHRLSGKPNLDTALLESTNNFNLLYDVQARVAWVVPQICVILHLVRAWTRSNFPGVEISYPDFPHAGLQFLKSTFFEFQTQTAATAARLDLESYFMEFSSVLSQLQDNQDLRPGGSNFPGLRRDQLPGVDFAHIATKPKTYAILKTTVGLDSGGPWPEMLRSNWSGSGASQTRYKVVTLFCSNLNPKPIIPNDDRYCRTWYPPPPNLDYLVTTTFCLKKLASTHGDGPVMLSPDHAWVGCSHGPFDPCDGRSSNRLQRIEKGNGRSGSSMGEILREASDFAAVIFGKKLDNAMQQRCHCLLPPAVTYQQPPPPHQQQLGPPAPQQQVHQPWEQWVAPQLAQQQVGPVFYQPMQGQSQAAVEQYQQVAHQEQRELPAQYLTPQPRECPEPPSQQQPLQPWEQQGSPLQYQAVAQQYQLLTQDQIMRIQHQQEQGQQPGLQQF